VKYFEVKLKYPVSKKDDSRFYLINVHPLGNRPRLRLVQNPGNNQLIIGEIEMKYAFCLLVIGLLFFISGCEKVSDSAVAIIG
jgi:hypothetical protein